MTGNPFKNCSMYQLVSEFITKVVSGYSTICHDTQYCSLNTSYVIHCVSVPEGNECTPNPCGPHSGCRVVQGSPVCFCLPEYEGNPPHQVCSLPSHPCNPSPCGPNTQCSVLENGFAKCTCLPGFLESPNTIRGCVEKRNPCHPNPCGHGALCDSNHNPPCYCPEPLIGNPYKSCAGWFFNTTGFKILKDYVWDSFFCNYP